MCLNDSVIHRNQMQLIREVHLIYHLQKMFFWTISIQFGPNQLLKWTYYHSQIFLSMAIIIYICVYVMVKIQFSSQMLHIAHLGQSDQKKSRHWKKQNILLTLIKIFGSLYNLLKCSIWERALDLNNNNSSYNLRFSVPQIVSQNM